MTLNKTAPAWAALDVAHRITARLAAGEIVTIAATDIAKFREARLMTKFDTREDRPKFLADVTVLPITNGMYALVRGDGYANITRDAPLRRWPIPATVAALKTLPWWTPVQSESQALDMALASGMLSDFVGERHLALTIRGRRQSPEFSFEFDAAAQTHTLDVRGGQIEVDAGLEGREIHLIEAKLGKRTNFHVRQLYYPLRMWRILAPEKLVSTTLLTWHDRVFSLRRYTFDPEQRYHALKEVAAVDYVFDDVPQPPLLGDVLADTEVEATPLRVPFPQADDIQKVIDIVDATAGQMPLSEIAERYAFVERQAFYYRGAARFLGLVAPTQGRYELTAHGRRFAFSKRGERHRILLERIASLPAFRDALEWLEQHDAEPTPALAASWVTSAAPRLTGRTPGRRAATVLAWSRWAYAATRQRTAKG